jgi:hypothetical protein
MTFRASRPRPERREEDPLGLIADFPGTWVGSGFNLIARPDNQHHHAFMLVLNATHELMTFKGLGADVPNRGSVQGDINVQGVSYVQQVNDRALNSAIHFENGLWLRVPETSDPPAGESYVRKATIPHGDSILAQSTSFGGREGGPEIDPVFSQPFSGSIPPLNKRPKQPRNEFDEQFTARVPLEFLPAGVKAGEAVRNPASILAAATKGQTIDSSVEIRLTSEKPDGSDSVLNIPFVVRNANVVRLEAIYWIETVRHPNGRGQFLQLQYVQRVILDFLSVRWPHISVATLVKQ